MKNLICPKYCPAPFCAASCPPGAITIDEKESNIYVETDKCNRCSICRVMCMSCSQDHRLSQRRPWVSSDWVRTR
ncbi:MAG: hypothetical protein V1780_06105 [Chloroflexota bacterium]